MHAPAAGCASNGRLRGTATVFVISGARAFRRHHARTDRSARRARGAENRAVGGLLDAADDRRALAGRVFRHRPEFHREAALRIEFGEGGLDAQSAVRQRAQAAPLEALTQLEDLGDEALRLAIAVANHSPRELIFDT